MMKKTKLVLAIATASLTMAGLAVAPQAQAHSKAKKHTHTHTSTSYSSSSSAERLAAAANNRVEALEQQLQAMQYELQALRSQANRSGAPADSAKVQELEQWMASVKSEPVVSKSKENMVFFRGGYSNADKSRGGWTPNIGNGTLNAGAGVATGANGDPLVGNGIDSDAWYFGAGFDFKLVDDLFGVMRGTDVFAELMFDYKEYSDKTHSVVTGQNVTTNQLTLAASPKVKFMKGSAIRPWLIPAGFELTVISPPSGAVTVLNPGMQFGGGVDYNIWQNLYVGADARYHYSADNIDGVNTDGVTAGGYLGIGF